MPVSTDKIAQGQAWFESLSPDAKARETESIARMTPEKRTAHILAQSDAWAGSKKRSEGMQDFTKEVGIRKGSDLDKYEKELQMRKSADRLPTTFQDQIISGEATVDKLARLVDFIERDPDHASDYGPLDNLAYQGAKALGVDTPEYDYASEMVGLTPAEIRKSMTGATATEQEMKEFNTQLPSMGNQPAKNLRIAKQLINDVLAQRRRLVGISKALGYDVGDVSEEYAPVPDRQPYPTDDAPKKKDPVIIRNVTPEELKRGYR